MNRYINIILDNQQVIKITCRSPTHISVQLSHLIDWKKADTKFWTAILETLAKELGSKEIKLEDMEREVRKLKRQQGLPDGMEHDIADRWTEIVLRKI